MESGKIFTTYISEQRLLYKFIMKSHKSVIKIKKIELKSVKNNGISQKKLKDLSIRKLKGMQHCYSGRKCNLPDIVIYHHNARMLKKKKTLTR